MVKLLSLMEDRLISYIEHDDAFNLEADDFSVGCWMQAENKDAYIVSGLNKTVQFSLVIISLTVIIFFAGVCYEH